MEFAINIIIVFKKKNSSKLMYNLGSIHFEFLNECVNDSGEIKESIWNF